ncbi:MULTISPECIES: PadR family transcriptional regulator [Rhodococcus]|uniref:PadR family transcriptional regulator n=1 Tax=Rhodococcus oxybenzonivorans TaxID=1990687 RepID=A0AAE4V6C1_9NOCA|nr:MULTISPECIES: PadR family transcriptional regulator [Rhodococcus]MDV7245369.1 PadR family transcriptional regulator [Rhodococcus oxybenzonivorans]MDV7268469.1 PadR family transcriptional regulator [Rhodococcus oxybenzonivorans]MDV7272351.1 PadR family transcriptional regulator [Rhodococcus oxybenzonivorans]MDV7336394.1 PadR family transcriptional regulator [Rhodococcus oxybenzonivorans]MDV7347694.1 PadR family transcriptional regulator [Rhodococcus oxybenzonivorans]
MALRHAVLAALIDESASGYQLTKIFDLSVANYWYASPQQLYAELTRLEEGGLISGHAVVQEKRPTKRVFTITDSGREALRHFIDVASKPTFIRDDLLVKVHAAEVGDLSALIEDLTERASHAEAKANHFEGLLALLRGAQTEDDFLADSPRIGPYLTGLRGISFERENAAWCRRTADVLASRLQSTIAAGS